MLVVTSVYNAIYQNLLNFVIKHDLKLLVYNKNDYLKLGEEIVTYKTEQLTVIDIPNYGRCDYAFLYYISKNYDNLPDNVLFTKANYMEQEIELEHALNNKNFTLIGKHIKYGLLNKEYDKSLLLNIGIECNDIEELFWNKSNYIDEYFQSYLTNDFYNMVYDKKPFIDDFVIQFGHGPCFCVTREIMLAHPVAIYDKLMDTFYKDKGHWTEWEGHTEEDTYFHLGKRYHDNLQRFWLLLFVQDYRNDNVLTDLTNYVTMKSEIDREPPSHPMGDWAIQLVKKMENDIEPVLEE